MADGYRHNGIFNYVQRLRYYWVSGAPVVTYAIMVLCFAIWVVEAVLEWIRPAAFNVMVTYGAFQPALALRFPWSWFTSMFLHSPSIFHVLSNMLTLLVIGPYLERLMGHWVFLISYVICGLGGATGLEVYSRLCGDWLMAAYGASGALFGLFAMVLVVFRRTGQDIRAMMVFIAINLVTPLFDHDVAWQAHVGGFIVGLVFTWLLVYGAPALRRHALGVRVALYGVVMVIILAGIIALCSPQLSALG